MRLKPVAARSPLSLSNAALAACVAAVMLSCASPGLAQNGPQGGAHDFDWEFGSWETSVRVRAPLSTADDWVEFHGASVVRPLSQGHANLVELDVTSGDRRIEGVSLRLFSPQSRQWSLNFANMRNGLLTTPVYGGFENGRGVFYGQDTVDGRVVLVRFVISGVTQASAHFEQAYSSDGGETWVVNWAATDKRRPG